MSEIKLLTFEEASERDLMNGTVAEAMDWLAAKHDDGSADCIEPAAMRQAAEGLRTLVARVNDLAASLNRASDACASVQKERDEAVAEIRALYRAYVNTLESARDRIIFLGGDCDPLGRMEEGDPHLIRTRAFLARYEGGR